MPQRRPYFVNFSNLVIPGKMEEWGELRLVSEVRDGGAVIARSTDLLRPVPWHELDRKQNRHYINIHYASPDLAAMNAIEIDVPANAIALSPEDAHGPSGSDWKISVVGMNSTDAVEVGLIRGIGSKYFTREPWRKRSPELGFSAPARVIHVPPSEDAAKAAFEQLRSAGGPVAICDCYAEELRLERIATILTGGRLLTCKRSVENRNISEKWAYSHKLSVRTSTQLHDRFVVGPQCGFLVGTSLNGIGNKHSFLVELDAVMQQQIQEVFDDLWSAAKPAW